MSGAHAPQFDTIFAAVGDDRVQMNGMTVFARNIQIPTTPRSILPVQFEVVGLRNHYVVMVQGNEAEIEVHDLLTFRLRSTMRPHSQAELLRAIDTIGSDFEDLLDAMVAAERAAA